MAKRTKEPEQAKRAGEELARGGAAPGASDLGLGDFKHPLDTVEGCEGYVQRLYFEITSRHGTKTANRIFDAWGTPPGRVRQRFEKVMLWSWFEIGKNQGLSLKEIATKLHEINKTVPREDRYGGQSVGAIVRAIERLPQYVPKAKHRRRR
jgi:hypothetical protein